MAYISLFNDLQLALNLAKIIRFQQSSKILNNVLYVIVFFVFILFTKSNISNALLNNWQRWLLHVKIKVIWKLIQNISRIKPRYIPWIHSRFNVSKLLNIQMSPGIVTVYVFSAKFISFSSAAFMIYFSVCVNAAAEIRYNINMYDVITLLLKWKFC